MRSSVIACGLGALGAVGGAWLVGRWCVGLVLIVLSAGSVAWGLLRDDGHAEPPQEPQALTVSEILRKSERALD